MFFCIGFSYASSVIEIVLVAIYGHQCMQYKNLLVIQKISKTYVFILHFPEKLRGGVHG